jgi:hypothetical protein
VVLANVPRLPADLVQKLARYVNAGGGLWIALGEQTDVKAFNEAFFEPSLALAPLPLLQPIGDAEDHAAGRQVRGNLLGYRAGLLHRGGCCRGSCEGDDQRCRQGHECQAANRLHGRCSLALLRALPELDAARKGFDRDVSAAVAGREGQRFLARPLANLLRRGAELVVDVAAEAGDREVGLD